MHSLKLIAIAALVVTPAVGHAQENSAKLGQKQKAWLVSNFRTFECGLTPGRSSVLTGAGTVSFEAGTDGGVDVAVTSGDGGVPTITAHAINTKGTGATNGRVATPACGAAAASSDSGAATCSVSGDDQAPTVRFSVPLSALGGDAASYVGTVTIVKGPANESAIGMYLSKKGYDYYQARGDMTAAKAGDVPALMIVARCDSAALTAKAGNPTRASYDLAVAKK